MNRGGGVKRSPRKIYKKVYKMKLNQKVSTPFKIFHFLKKSREPPSPGFWILVRLCLLPKKIASGKKMYRKVEAKSLTKVWRKKCSKRFEVKTKTKCWSKKIYRKVWSKKRSYNKQGILFVWLVCGLKVRRVFCQITLKLNLSFWNHF